MEAKDKAIRQMNRLGNDRTPFLFIIDFAMEKPVVIEISKINTEKIKICLPGFSLPQAIPAQVKPAFSWIRHPISYDDYLEKYDLIQKEIKTGNSYLLNLTCPTPVQTDLSLENIFFLSRAPYKLWIRDLFTVFSPEPFVRIFDEKIASFPMKGTIDAAEPDARNKILNDPKEIAEHNTIVDLIRNDLSMVATQVRVEDFRYIEEIQTHEKNILQVSSRITGHLPPQWHQQIGDLLFTLLPAGSVTGAPKKKTVEIIENTEGYHRGFYTGIFGIFDGKNLDSAVMIRFIEQGENGLIFKSGGGITSFSQPEKEYREMIDKVYLPIV